MIEEIGTKLRCIDSMRVDAFLLLHRVILVGSKRGTDKTESKQRINIRVAYFEENRRNVIQTVIETVRFCSAAIYSRTGNRINLDQFDIATLSEFTYVQ